MIYSNVTPRPPAPARSVRRIPEPSGPTKNFHPGQYYPIVFGGQYDVIERIVYGMDWATFSSYRILINRLTQKYYSIIEKILEKNEIAVAIPKPEEIDEIKKIVEERFWSGVGFRWLSREEYDFQGNRVKKHEI